MHSGTCQSFITRSPGTDYGKWYHLDEGEACFTNGERVYNSDDGFDWVQLDDGGWVAAHLPGIWHLINHSIEYLSVELAVVILDVLHMDVGQLLIALPFFDRPMGIPFGILHP